MRTSYKKILVASDGSDNSYLAFKEAVRIAVCTKSQLFIIQVIDNRVDSLTPNVLDDTLENQITLVEKELETLADEARKLGVPHVQIAIKQGQPHDIIASKFPKKNSIDLIVIGSTKKNSPEKFWIGSTASYVISHAYCNVLVIRKKISN